MKSFDNEEKQIIEKLKKLPKINDNTDKDVLFERISQRLDKKPSPKVRNRKLIPILSTAFVIALLLIVIPSLINTNPTMESKEEYSTKESFDRSTEIGIKSTEPKSDKKMEMEKAATPDTDQKEEIETQNHSDADAEAEHVESFVIQSVDDAQSIVYAAVADNQVQYVIPVSLLVPKDSDIEAYYNELGTYLHESEWGVQESPFDQITFHVDLENSKVSMKLPENFSPGDGEATYHIFTQLLSVMFSPYGIEKVDLEFENGQGVEFGQMGAIKDLKLDNIKSNYKVFQASEQSKKFLIPIPQKESTIEEALMDLKNSNEDFNVHQSIPEDINFTVEEENNQLTIIFSEKLDSLDSEKGVTMIESILMTAKSFGYETVRFNNMLVEQIGPYDVTNPIHVPEAVNPIH